MEICCVGAKVTQVNKMLCDVTTECIFHTGQVLEKYCLATAGFEPTDLLEYTAQMLFPTELRGQVRFEGAIFGN